MEHTKQKDGEEHDRQHVDSDVTMQDLVDSYMYPFQARRMPYPAALGATVRRYGTSPDTRPFSGSARARARAQACVEKGRVSGLMCSYNSVNGVPSCANDWLIKEIARGEWGFDGCVLGCA